MSTTFRRREVLLGLLGALAVGTAAGCSSPEGGEASASPTGHYGTLASLPYLGAGTKAAYEQRLDAAADEAAQQEVIDEAVQLNGVVGRDLFFADVLNDMRGQVFRLNEDGTVTGDEMVVVYMSNAAYWRVGDTTFELCPDQECAYSASWRVETGTTDVGNEHPEGYTFILMANGEDTQVTRSFTVK